MTCMPSHIDFKKLWGSELPFEGVTLLLWPSPDSPPLSSLLHLECGGIVLFLFLSLQLFLVASLS